MTQEIKRAYIKEGTVALGDVIELDGTYVHVISINTRGNAIRYVSAVAMLSQYRFCTHCHKIAEKHSGTKCLFSSTRLNISVDSLEKAFETPRVKVAKKQLHDFHEKQQGRLDGRRANPKREEHRVYHIPTSGRIRGMTSDLTLYDEYTYWK